MVLVSERVVMDEADLTVELDEDRGYRLRYGELVEYTPGRRRVRGRATPYEFRSVEQLRYDFERDVEALGGRLA
jgi:hypothetical protein